MNVIISSEHSNIKVKSVYFFYFYDIHSIYRGTYLDITNFSKKPTVKIFRVSCTE